MTPRRVTKRGVRDAFKRVAERPDCASVLRTEFPGEEPGLPSDKGVLRMALPLGWSDSPGYFQSRGKHAPKLHCAYQPVSPLVGNAPFASHMFVDDAMIIDVDFPLRIGRSANAWEWSSDTVLGQ